MMAAKTGAQQNRGGRKPIPRKPACETCGRAFGVEVSRSKRGRVNDCGDCYAARATRQANAWYHAHHRTRPVQVGTWCLCVPVVVVPPQPKPEPAPIQILRERQRFDSAPLERLIDRASNEARMVILSGTDAEQIRLALGYIRELESESA